MQVLTITLLSLLSVALTVAAADECTPEQSDAYEKYRDQRWVVKCRAQAFFDACDDDCHAMYQDIAAHAPKCIRGFVEPQVMAQNDLDACEKWRMSSNAYMPQVVPGFRNCTSDQHEAWRETHPTTPFGECSTNATQATSCSDACLKILEDGVANAPLCVAPSGYTLGEQSKFGLANCLRVRNETLANNVVLNTLVQADGSKTMRNSTTPNAPAPAATSAAAGTTMYAVASVAVVLTVALANVL